MVSMSTLERQLSDSLENEAKAATRLRRAQTIFDKHYQRSLSLRRTINQKLAHAHNVAHRLLGESKP